VYFNVILYGGL